MSLIVGIDPGLEGGICLLEDGKIKEVHPMPTFEIELNTKLKSGKFKKRRYVDANGIKNIIKWHQDGKYCIEHVRSLHKMSAESNFSMGHGCGVIHGCVRMLTDEFYLYKPKQWQEVVWIEEDKVFKENGRIDTKPTSLNAAKRIFPEQSWLKTKRSSVPADGLFDSALIAYSQYLWEKK